MNMVVASEMVMESKGNNSKGNDYSGDEYLIDDDERMKSASAVPRT